MNTDTPPPGSPEAVKLGCICPTGDNGHGKGFGGIAGLYVCGPNCPLHPVNPHTWTAEDERDRSKHRADIL